MFALTKEYSLDNKEHRLSGRKSEHNLRGLTQSRRQATWLSQVPITLAYSSTGIAQVKTFTPRSWNLKKGSDVLKKRGTQHRQGQKTSYERLPRSNKERKPTRINPPHLILNIRKYSKSQNAHTCELKTLSCKRDLWVG